MSTGEHGTSRAPAGAFASFWRAVRPDRMLFGPIFTKEVIVSGRRASTYWTRGLFAFLVAIFVSAVLWGHWDSLQYEGTAQRLQGMQEIGPTLAWTIVWLQFVIVTLIAPALTAGCISEETSNRTLSALMTTPMTSAQIVLGKLASRVVQLIILGLLTLPALLMLRLLGGLNTQAVIAGAALTTSAAFFAASVGLLLSIINNRPWSVMVLAEVITLAYCFGPIAIATVYMMLAGGGGSGGSGVQRLFAVLAHMSPALSLIAVTMKENGAPMSVSSFQLWSVASGATIVISCLICALAVALTRRAMRTHIRGSVRAERKKVKNGRASRTVSDDPIFWHEMRSKWVGSKWAAAVLGVIVLGFLGWVFYLATVNDEWEGLHYTFVLMLGLAQALMAMVTTTGRIASERQKRTWEVLLTTPLPAWRIVMGKLIAGVVRLSPVPILLGVYFMIFAALGMVRWQTVAEVPLVVSTWSIFLAATGLLWSSVFRRPITASVVNMVTAAGFWVGAPVFVMFVFTALLQREPEDVLLMRFLLLINPFYMLHESLTGGIPDYWSSASGFRDGYRILDADLTPIAFFWIIVAVGAGILAASAAMVGLTSLRARALPRRA